MLLALGYLLSPGILLAVGCGYSEEEKAEGKHCRTRIHDFKEAIKEQLDDPDSFKDYRDTLRIGPAYPLGPEAGEHAGKLVHNGEMEFGARNALGGMVRATAYRFLSNENCQARITGITPH